MHIWICICMYKLNYSSCYMYSNTDSIWNINDSIYYYLKQQDIVCMLFMRLGTPICIHFYSTLYPCRRIDILLFFHFSDFSLWLPTKDAKNSPNYSKHFEFTLHLVWILLEPSYFTQWLSHPRLSNTLYCHCKPISKYLCFIKVTFQSNFFGEPWWKIEKNEKINITSNDIVESDLKRIKK